MSDTLQTRYASAERASDEELKRQINLVSQHPMIKDIFDAMPVFVAILNHQRQMVYANKAFRDYFEANKIVEFKGKRPGEAVNCIHSAESPGGCGTADSCTVCGAVNAILLSQSTGKAQMECRITLENGDPLDLMVMANQYIIEGNEYTVFAASDISDQNRRKALERIFFHDLLNITGALKGFLEILNDASENEREEYISFSRNIAEHLIEEILAHKELTQAEDSELKTYVTAFTTKAILNEIAVLYEKHMVSLGKKIIVSPEADDLTIQTDKTLLRRIIGNLVKNALEAIADGETVILNCTRMEDMVEFSVWGNSIIPKPVQLQIFQRSFSTKGKGRGLGTYSVKLLTERYLLGKVRFTSEREKGTTFYVKIPVKIKATD